MFPLAKNYTTMSRDVHLSFSEATIQSTPPEMTFNPFSKFAGLSFELRLLIMQWLALTPRMNFKSFPGFATLPQELRALIWEWLALRKCFELFGKLSTELRCLIWSYTMPGKQWIEVYYNQQRGRPESGTPLPVTFYVCRESRDTALKHYQQLYDPPLSPIYLRPNFDRMYFCMGDRSCAYLKDGRRYLHALLNGVTKNVLQSVMEVAVQITAYWDSASPQYEYLSNIEALTSFRNLENLKIVAGKSCDGDTARDLLRLVPLKQLRDEEASQKRMGGDEYICDLCDIQHTLPFCYPYWQNVLKIDMEDLEQLDKMKRGSGALDKFWKAPKVQGVASCWGNKMDFLVDRGEFSREQLPSQARKREGEGCLRRSKRIKFAATARAAEQTKRRAGQGLA